jgi:hypothetical protein
MRKVGMERSLIMSTTLREQTINTLKLGHYSDRTIQTYIARNLALEVAAGGLPA